MKARRSKYRLTKGTREVEPPTRPLSAKTQARIEAARKRFLEDAPAAPTSWFWVSWYHFEKLGGFTLFCPWWVSGSRGCSDEDEGTSVCAAIPAASEVEAKEVVRLAYDVPPAELEWRFAETRDRDSPFSDRFPRAKWMAWPPEKRSQGKP
jgi:hypothetical protein